jgi:hypothetical protein
VGLWCFILFHAQYGVSFQYLFFDILEINPHAPLEKKEAELKAAAKDFSYKKVVDHSKKRIVANCTPEVEDLFKKIFNSNPENRITFSQIREHPLFVKYFPVVHQPSRILYGKKFESKVVKKANQMTKNKPQKA